MEWNGQLYLYLDEGIDAVGVERHRHLATALASVKVADECAIQKGPGAAGRRDGTARSIRTDTFRHSAAVGLLESGHDIRTVPEPPGHPR